MAKLLRVSEAARLLGITESWFQVDPIIRTAVRLK